MIHSRQQATPIKDTPQSVTKPEKVIPIVLFTNHQGRLVIQAGIPQDAVDIDIMAQEKEPHTWQSILTLMLIWSLIIGGLGYALHYKWTHPDRYETDIEHR